jgi:hypothetical protein
MRCVVRFPAWLLLAAAPLPGLAQSPVVSANYELARPATAWGTGQPAIGLSVQAGQPWFGRVGLERGLHTEQWAVGAGYRWTDGQSLLLQVTRGRGPEGLGLAVRYDWPRYYLRLSYDPRLGEGSQDMLRFSAGVRF